MSVRITNVIKNKYAQILVAILVFTASIFLFYFLNENINTAEAEVVNLSYTSARDGLSWVVPDGVTSIEVYAWGGGGGGAGGGSVSVGGAGAGGGFASGTLSVTPGDTLTLYVGGGGTQGAFAGANSGSGGGGGGYSGLTLSGSPLILAAGGGGGGGGDNSSATAGGAGGVGGGETGGNGASSGTAGSGNGGSQSTGGTTNTTSGNIGTAGSSLTGGLGGNGVAPPGADGGGPAGGTNGGGAGGSVTTDGFGGGGGGAGGYYGGGGGSGSASGNAGGGGGGGGSSYATSTATATTTLSGSGTTPGNDGGTYHNGTAGDGGSGGGTSSSGSAGTDGQLVIRYTSPATTWNATDWTDRIAITIDADKVDSTLTDFPVYVNLGNMPDYFFSSVRSDCGDIRVMNSALTVEMPREIVSCDTDAKTGEMHFKANSISSSVDTTFYIYYNNTDDYPYPDEATYGAQNVWTNDYIGVWHLDESVNNDSGGYKDSTAHGNDGTGTSMALSEVSGQMGSGQDFDGAADFITITESVPINPYDSITVSAWLSPDAYNEWGGYVGNYYDNADGTESGWGLLSHNTDSFGFFTETADTTGTNSTGSCGDTSYVCNSNNVLNNGWHYLVGTYQGTQETIYLDYDAEQDTNTSPGGAFDYTPDNPLYFGVFKDSNETEYTDGQIDEVRIASSSRSAAWIKAEYYNQLEEAFFVAPTWAVDEWGDRIKITIASTSISSTLTDFPVYVDLSDIDPYFFSVSRDDCGDIRIMNSSLTTEMPREVVSCDVDAHTGELHFKANSLSSSANTVFWLYYNNPLAYDYDVSDTYGAENVWTNGYLSVYHMNQDPSTSQIHDSTSNRNVGTSAGSMTNTDLVSSQIGNALQFDGANDYINLGNISSLSGTVFTVSTWYKVDTFDIAWQALIAKGETTNFRMHRSNTTNYLDASISNGPVTMDSGVNVNDSGYHLVHALRDSGGIGRIYHDGSESASTSVSANVASGNDIWIGNNPGSTARYWEGIVDEVRIADSAGRSADWIAAEYLNQNTPTSFYSIDTPETEWNAVDWSDYIVLTVSTTNIDEDLTDFPVYIDLSDFPALMWSNVNSDCGDIRMTTDDGSPVELPREIVQCNTVNSTGELHFKASSLSSTTDTTFRLYYNNASSTDYVPYSTYGAQNVWTNDYVAVWHMSTNPLLGTFDSTSGGYNMNQVGSSMNIDSLTSGKMGSSTDFDGVDDAFSISGHLSEPANVTLSLWADVSNAGDLISFGDGLAIRSFNGATQGARLYFHDGSTWRGVNSGIDIRSTGWRYLTGVMNDVGNEQNIYIDGVLASTTNDTQSINYSTLGTDTFIGHHGNGSTWWANGGIDEVRVASTTRSASWIKAEYYNQSNTASFYSIDETAPTPSPMYFATAPDDFSSTSIDMIATTATDENAVEYFFTAVTGSCGANIGTGGTNSAWQSSTSYTDTGLQPNKCYGYTVNARDIYRNYGATSTASSTYSAAAIPGQMTFSNVTDTTIDLTNDANGNSASNPTTYFAVQVSATSPSDATWDSKYVDALGDPSASAVWLTDAQIDALTVTGLQDVTQYTFQVKARNELSEETSFSATNNTTTLDGTPPAPDPITFASAPDGADTSSVSMTATTATDDSSVEYYFTAVTGSCGADIGTGGTDSGWQGSTSYTDSGLQPNQCYAYTVTARDTLGNYGATSSASAAYTEANTPGTPIVTALATTTLTITNTENTNPSSNPATTFALQVSNSVPTDATWNGKYVDASGDPSDTAVWLTDAQLDNLTIQGLSGYTSYTLQAKARNGDGDETPFSSTVNGLTKVIENRHIIRLLPGARLR